MIIGISGMISSGKTTLVNQLKDVFPKSLFLKEFEEDDEVFNTFLKWFYEKKENLTIGFQSYIVENHSNKFEKLLHLYNDSKLKPENDHIFLDRFSIEHYIFAHVNLQSKSKYYLEAYDALFDVMIKGNEIPDHAIFLDVNFDVFQERLFKRGREVEVKNWNKNKDYFYKLQSIYKKLFEKLCKRFQIPYTIIDTNNLSADEVLNTTLHTIKNIKKRN